MSLDRDTWTVGQEIERDRFHEAMTAGDYDPHLLGSALRRSAHTKETPMTTNPITADVERDVTRLADLQVLITEATSEADSIKHRLREAFASAPGSHEIAGHRLSVTPSTRFDEAQARDVLPEEIIATATVAKLDATAVKRMVAPTVYALCCKASGDARISLR